MAIQKKFPGQKTVLIGCEYSGIVSQAFEQAGFYTVSCDLLPRETSGIHYTGDIFDVLYEGWDAAIFFPPCTYLCNAQLHMQDYERKKKRALAMQFVQHLWDADIKHIAIENPKGYLNTHFRPPDQITNPHNFGSLYSKDICLWLKNLPPLISTCYTAGRKKVSNHVNSRMTQTQKSKIKSKFFPEVAAAMATQWSSIIRS